MTHSEHAEKVSEAIGILRSVEAEDRRASINESRLAMRAEAAEARLEDVHAMFWAWARGESLAAPPGSVVPEWAFKEMALVLGIDVDRCDIVLEFSKQQTAAINATMAQLQ